MEKLRPTLDELDQTIITAIAVAWDQERLTGQLGYMAAQSQTIAGKMTTVGDQALDLVTETEGQPQLESSLIHFRWAEQAKSFLILWRDVMFELQKADLLARHSQVDAAALDQFRFRSRAVVQAASEELRAFFEKEKKEIESARNGPEKQLRTWGIQANPWPKYREQLAQLAEQCQKLAEQHRQQSTLSTGLQNIQELVLATVARSSETIASLMASAERTIEYIDGKPGPGKVASHLEDIASGIDFTGQAPVFTTSLDGHLASMIEKLAVPVGTSSGMLLVREIAFQKRSRQWLESEILPLLYEVWEVTGQVGSNLKMALVNIRNRTLLLATDAKDGRPTEDGEKNLSQPILAFLKNARSAIGEIEKLRELVLSRLDQEFTFPKVYRQHHEFLPIPLQSTIDALRLDQNALLGGAKSWLSRQVYSLRQAQIESQRENSLSISEKVVRYIHQHTPDEGNSEYSNIFLTKGYIGESFIVGRNDELEHIEQLVGNWYLGFRGAVILSGRRFAGKSLFGDLVADRFFHGNVVRLKPDATVNVASRRLTTTHDLGEALDFIEKYTLNERPLVWIDDLELWADANTPLSQNVRKLRRFIDSYSDRMFFLVSMSTWLREHLDRTCGLSHAFQAEINLDQMSADEIRQAIVIRHGATHRTLVDADGKTVTPQQFQGMCNRVYRATDGNVGEALTRWSASVAMVDEEHVRFEPLADYPLPKLLTADGKLLLRNLLLEKKTNEYRLRKAFGPAFKDKYGGILQRLQRTGLLTRRLDGWLEVNEVAVNEVGKQVFG